MDSQTAIARTAGFLYLVTIVTGIFSLIYVPSHLYVHGDIVATSNHIVESQALYRSGIFVGAIGYVAFTLLPLVLFRLLAPVNRPAGVCMVVLALIAMPMDFLALANQVDLLSLLTDQKYQRPFASNDLYAHVALLRDAASDKIVLSEIFWGLWLLPFGLLVFRSGFLPKILGVALMVGCFGYLLTVTGEIFSIDLSLGGWVSLPASIGEIGTGLWLLIVGPHRWCWPRRSVERAG